MPNPQDHIDLRLSNTLRKVRLARRISQLALSLQIGVSQRHVSFVESGRAKPSRELLAHWLSELKVPFLCFVLDAHWNVVQITSHRIHPCPR